MGSELRTIVAALFWATVACDPRAELGRSDALERSPRLAPSDRVRAVAEEGPRQVSPTSEVEDVPAHTRPASLRLGYAHPVAQTVACGPLGFVHLTERGFDAYDYSNLRRTLTYRHLAFTHVVAQPGYSFLLVGAGNSLLYYQANTRLTALAHLPALGPLHVWPDTQRRERLWVHYLKDDAVHHFELPRKVKERALLLSSVALYGYGGRGLARLAAGQWLYIAQNESGGAGLRMVDGTRRVWVHPSWSTDTLVAASALRFWSIEAERVAQFEVTPLDRLHPHGVTELAGEIWAAVSDGPRLASLSQTADGARRVWTLQVNEYNRWHAMELADLSGTDQPVEARDVSLCLVPDRPWVVWGRRDGVQVVDFERGEVVWGGR